MKMAKRTTLGFILLFLLAAFVSAQTQNVVDSAEPKVLKAVAPTYPEVAILARQVSTIEIDVAINSEGSVTKAVPKAIANRITPKILQLASISATRRWKFNESKSEKRKVSLIFVFRLSDNITEQGIFFNPPYEIEVVSKPIKVKP